MTDTLQPYLEYKDSGIEWLGAIPEHWKLRRIKTLLREVERRSKDGSGILLSLTKDRGLVPQSELTDKSHTSETLVDYKVCLPDEIVMDCMQAWSGMFAVANVEGLVSPNYAVFAPLETVDMNYLLEIFKTPLWISQFAIESKGIGFNRLRTDRFGIISVTYPPTSEQVTIVRYLNQADLLIRHYISAKKKLIALLNEQKQGIINYVVTRGLEPDVQFKPSGTEWCGEVPEHWDIKRIKHVTEILRGKFSHRPQNDPSLYDGPYPFIQTEDVANARKYIQSYKQTLNDKGFAVSKMVPNGTLVMTIAANIGDVALLTFDACFPDSIVGFVPKDFIQRDYLYYALGSLKDEFLKNTPVNAQGNLNVERIGASYIPVPPFTEQARIVKYIESVIVNTDTTINTAKQQIELIREYRTRLIADVVTGRLDVRSAEFTLPEQFNDVDLSIEDEYLEDGAEIDAETEELSNTD